MLRSEPFDESLYHSLFMSHPEPMWVFDVETLAFLNVNAAAIARYGYTREEFLSMRITDIRPEEEIPRMLESIARGPIDAAHTRRWRHRTKTGEEFIIEASTHRMMHHGREIEFVFARDVTGRIREEEEERESRDRYHELFELGNEAILQIDNETGRILEANTAATLMYGYTREELLMLRNTDLSAEPEDTRRVTRTFQGRVVVPLRYHRRRDGTVFPVEIDGRFFIWKGRPVHVAAIRDVTERERVNEEIRALNTELERRVAERTAELENAVQQLEAFSYSVSHDLQVPLRGIHGFTSILLSEHAAQLDEDGTRLLTQVRAAAERMAQLIEDLLRLARVNRVNLMFDDVDLAAMTRDIIGNLCAEYPQRLVDLITPERLIIRADPLLMRIALDNLLQNAWKFSRHRERTHIELGIVPDSHPPAIFIHDNGAGFDMAHADRLFEPFHRMHSPMEYEGTGIGLAIVHRVILRHGGSIRAHAEVDRGATFTFTLS